MEYFAKRPVSKPYSTIPFGVSLKLAKIVWKLLGVSASPICRGNHPDSISYYRSVTEEINRKILIFTYF